MLMYNPEDKTYSKFITIEEMAEVQEKIKQIEERLKNTPVMTIFELIEELKQI